MTLVSTSAAADDDDEVAAVIESVVCSICRPNLPIFNAALSRFVFRAGDLQYFP